MSTKSRGQRRRDRTREKGGLGASLPPSQGRDLLPAVLTATSPALPSVGPHPEAMPSYWPPAFIFTDQYGLLLARGHGHKSRPHVMQARPLLGSAEFLREVPRTCPQRQGPLRTRRRATAAAPGADRTGRCSPGRSQFSSHDPDGAGWRGGKARLQTSTRRWACFLCFRKRSLQGQVYRGLSAPSSRRAPYACT